MAILFDRIPPRPVADDGFRLLRRRYFNRPVFIFTKLPHGGSRNTVTVSMATSGARDSYLDMWRKAMDREKKSTEFEMMAEKSAEENEKEGDQRESGGEELEKRRNADFEKLLDVSEEERDRVQRMQVIDRAAAAIAAARALLKENLPRAEKITDEIGNNRTSEEIVEDQQQKQKGNENGSLFQTEPGRTPGPSFWSWFPPPSGDDIIISEIDIQPLKQASLSPVQAKPVVEKERKLDVLSIPFENSSIETNPTSPLPPLQSFLEVGAVELSHSEQEQELEVEFSTHASEAVDALSKVDENSSTGVNPDGTRWWKETGVEERSDGVMCKWTLTRGISSDSSVEWENKYWEAADELGYKELGSEKSGRDAYGNVWREYWKESLAVTDGVVHIEKTADKWGKNARGEEWQEQWWEHYDDCGKAEKWAHKWCSIDPNTPVDVGHAHVWHERWGEKYDGQGGSMKYTDKWAERNEGDGWSKWGDKWDENFDQNSQGVKQGEKWWEGKNGDKWKRTWGEGHNGSGWVHKYGMSSSGDEHWDNHVQEETWYEKFPHFGFQHCVENSVQLREVKAPSQWEQEQGQEEQENKGVAV